MIRRSPNIHHEHNLSDRESDNGNDDIEVCFSAKSSKRRKTDPAMEIIDTPTDPDKERESMKILRQPGKDFDHDEDLGEKVNPLLAVVNARIKASVDRKLAKDLCEKQLRPENCEFLRVPKINKELWVNSNMQKIN